MDHTHTTEYRPMSTHPTLRYFAESGNTGFEVVTLATLTDKRAFMVARTGKFVLVTQPSDLAVVPTPTLLALFNSYRKTQKEAPLDRFRDAATAQTRVYAVLAALATPFTAPTAPEGTMTAVAAPEKPKASAKLTDEQKAANLKARTDAKAAKDAEKADKKAAAKGAKAPGVIMTIYGLFDTDKGATLSEFLAVAKAKFPERDPNSMSTTFRIQSSRLTVTHGKKIHSAEIEGREGRVYKFVDRGPIPGKPVVKADPAPVVKAEKVKAEPKAKAGKATKTDTKVLAAVN